MSNNTILKKFGEFVLTVIRDGPPILTLIACVALTTVASIYQLNSDSILQGLLVVNILIAATLLSERWFISRENRNLIEETRTDVLSLTEQIGIQSEGNLDRVSIPRQSRGL